MSCSQIPFSSLSPERQELVRKMQRVNFGYLKNLRIVDFEPDFHDDFECVTCYRFPGDNEPRLESYLDDFILPAEVCEFLTILDDLVMVKIVRVQIRHGLPFQMEVEDLK